jgi:hypothetical protein
VDPILAILGSAVGGLFQFLGMDRQARAVEEAARSQERATRSLVDAAIVQWHELGRMVDAQMGALRDVTFWQQDTQRTRIYYNFKALQASQGLVLLGVGAGLVGLTLYLSAKEAK